MQDNAQENESDEISKSTGTDLKDSLSSIKTEEFLDIADVVSLHEVLQKRIRLPRKQKTQHRTNGRTSYIW